MVDSAHEARRTTHSPLGPDRAICGSRCEFRALLAHAPIPVLVLAGPAATTLDERTLSLVWANHAFADLLGHRRATVMSDLLHPDSLGEYEFSEVWLSTGATDTITTVCRLVRANGSTLWAKLHISTLDHGDHRLGTVFIEDCTDQHWSDPRHYETPREA